MTGNSRVTEADKKIAGKIKKLRETSGAFVTVTASHLGISYQSYQKLEGGRTAIRAVWLKTLSDVFGVPVSYFYEDVDVSHGDVANAPVVLTFAKAIKGVPQSLAMAVCAEAISKVKSEAKNGAF